MELKTARQIARLTQQQLAERVGVDDSAISLLEREERNYLTAGYGVIVRIARELNVDTETLFPVPTIDAKSQRNGARA